MATIEFFGLIGSGAAVSSASITAQNTFCDPVRPVTERTVNLSVGGSGWTATVTLQRSFDNGSTWLDVDSWTAPAERIFDPGTEGKVIYRLGVKTGGFTSGTIPVRLSQ